MSKKARERKMKRVKASKDAAKEAEKSPRKGVKTVPSSSGLFSNRKLLYAVMAVAAVAVAGWMLSTSGSGLAGYLTQQGGGMQDAGSELVSQKVVDFLQSRLEMSYPGIEVEAVGVEEYPNMTDTYEVMVRITYQGQAQELPYYASKDGKQLFSIIGDLDEEFETPEPAQTEPQNTGDVCSQLGISKSDKPKVEVFIMSYCPYGLQMQKAVLPVMELLGDKADFSIKWVYYVMHGKDEIDENTRQYCIQKVFGDKYIAYAECFAVTGEVDSCLTEAGIDSTALDACIAEADEEFNITGLYNDQKTWLSGRYPLYNVHLADNQNYGVGGSPTTVINGQVVSISRSPEIVKQAVCCAFSTPPAECSQTLSSAAASPGIGGGTGTDTGAEC
jgi:hypothetical protein